MVLEDQDVRLRILEYVLEKGISARELGFSPSYINRVKRRLLPVSDNLLKACLKFLSSHELKEILSSHEAPATNTESAWLQFLFKLIMQLVHIERENGNITEEHLQVLNLDPATLKFIIDRFLIKKKKGCYLLDKRNLLVREAYVFIEYLERFESKRRDALEKLHATSDSLHELTRRLKILPREDRMLLVMNVVTYDIMVQEEEVVNKVLLHLQMCGDLKYIETLRKALNDQAYKYALVLRVFTSQMRLPFDVKRVCRLMESTLTGISMFESLWRNVTSVLVGIARKVDLTDLPESLIDNFWSKFKEFATPLSDINIINQRNLARRFSRLLWNLVLEELEDFLDYLKNEELKELEKTINSVVASVLEVDVNYLEEFKEV